MIARGKQPALPLVHPARQRRELGIAGGVVLRHREDRIDRRVEAVGVVVRPVAGLQTEAPDLVIVVQHRVAGAALIEAEAGIFELGGSGRIAGRGHAVARRERDREGREAGREAAQMRDRHTETEQVGVVQIGRIGSGRDPDAAIDDDQDSRPPEPQLDVALEERRIDNAVFEKLIYFEHGASFSERVDATPFSFAKNWRE